MDSKVGKSSSCCVILTSVTFRMRGHARCQEPPQQPPGKRFLRISIPKLSLQMHLGTSGIYVNYGQYLGWTINRGFPWISYHCFATSHAPCYLLGACVPQIPWGWSSNIQVHRDCNRCKWIHRINEYQWPQVMSQVNEYQWISVTIHEYQWD